ncbi:MBL fold metallo-hydrolase [Pyrobaculum neutrophilum]|uniref:Beta-lactamase domain protein n=1 Tax=Pyrobaculum neutrophilum (strain DSM 2338 / JCM 9278 / NBRC 100436 / V24Sta) TaxID=444157 RepID=B1YCR1_PYRNV|nr:MBL fold metallo-hydrolase [Pyrobaculum neutrophilum]ACB39574.1 beta-lactamase domain protein [Pyrobaculum neutrophilum V24Sta]
MEVEVVTAGPLETNTYLVCRGDECLVIDPAEAAPVVKALGRRGVAAVVATHLHFDHVSGVGELVKLYNAPFYAHPADWAVYRELNEVAVRWGFGVPDIPEPKPTPRRLWDLDVLHTPGHTPGSISLVAEGFVFTGDTLFRRSVGRTDLPLGDWRALTASVCALYQLPKHYLAYPGHGPATTIGEEASGNPFIRHSQCNTLNSTA